MSSLFVSFFLDGRPAATSGRIAGAIRAEAAVVVVVVVAVAGEAAALCRLFLRLLQLDGSDGELGEGRVKSRCTEVKEGPGRG